VYNIGMTEALVQRDIPVYKAQDILSPVHDSGEEEILEIPETKLKQLPRDENHPLWQDKPAYTYMDRTWMPKNMEMEFGLAVTNSLSVPNLPDRINKKMESTTRTLNTELRLENLIKSAYIGDAVQRKLPRNFKVPYIGWHPVESKMRPRNQYDTTAFSWGRSMPREYGIPNQRKLVNLSRSLFNEMVKSDPGVSDKLLYSAEKEVYRQFITAPGGELLRYYLNVDFSIKGRQPLSQAAGQEEVEKTQDTAVISVAPQSPMASMHPTNIYRNERSHPVTSLEHSHPFINTVFDFQTSPIGDPFTDPHNWISSRQRSRCLILGFTAALGQARLMYGEEVEGDLPKPVSVNVVSTNGVHWELATFQLNSVDLASKIKNLFFHHGDSLRLMDYCGYREARPALEGVKPETFSLLQALITAEI